MSTAKYERLSAVAKEHYNEIGFCGVIAVAVAANVSVGKAQAALKRAGRKPRQGTSGLAMRAALSELGFITTYTSNGKDARPTINKVAPTITGAALLLTSGHVTAVVDGIVHDYVGQKSRKRVWGTMTVQEFVGPLNALGVR